MQRLGVSSGWPRKVPVADGSLYVDVVGEGPPVLLMHGGPSADLWTMGGFRPLADQFTLVFYDHRCNGRSTGFPVSSMTWANLCADAEALRTNLGFARWAAVLGHSFGGHVALEYALRHPDRLARLVLVDSGAESRWARENAPTLLRERGHSAEQAELVRRWFHGEFESREYFGIFRRIGPAYYSGSSWLALLRSLRDGAWRSRPRPEPLIFAGRDLLDGWSVLDRLGEIAVPTLVLAGRDDFVFPPPCQYDLASGIADAQLLLVDHAGHSPQDEQQTEVVAAIRSFLAARPT